MSYKDKSTCLDDWVYKNAKQLKKDIRTHLNYGSKNNHVRLIMISIRQWYKLKGLINE